MIRNNTKMSRQPARKMQRLNDGTAKRIERIDLTRDDSSSDEYLTEADFFKRIHDAEKEIIDLTDSVEEETEPEDEDSQDESVEWEHKKKLIDEFGEQIYNSMMDDFKIEEEKKQDLDKTQEYIEVGDLNGLNERKPEFKYDDETQQVILPKPMEVIIPHNRSIGSFMDTNGISHTDECICDECLNHYFSNVK